MENFDTLRRSSLELEDEPSLYVYRLRTGDHEQVGLAGCYSLDDYDRDVIKKHERTRRDKEDDRTRHMLALGAQTGPVFLTYRANDGVGGIVKSVTSVDPLFDFVAADGVSHTIWRAGGADRDALVAAVGGLPALYIADGHHRAASAARARAEMRSGRLGRRRSGGRTVDVSRRRVSPRSGADPAVQPRREGSGRVVAPDAFLGAVRERFEVGKPRDAAALTPAAGEIAMYLAGGWNTLRPRVGRTRPIRSGRSTSACCRISCSRRC